MAKTADVGSGQVIASAWGNEIRDRTCQVFATQAELTAWAAPNGSFAVNLADRALWERIGTNWYRQKGVVVFGSTTERDSAWTNPPSGSLCVTIDTNTLWQRIGTTWTPIAPPVWGRGQFTTGTVISATDIKFTPTGLTGVGVTIVNNDVVVNYPGSYRVTASICYNCAAENGFYVDQKLARYRGGTQVDYVDWVSGTQFQRWALLTTEFVFTGSLANDSFVFIANTDHSATSPWQIQGARSSWSVQRIAP